MGNGNRKNIEDVKRCFLYNYENLKKNKKWRTKIEKKRTQNQWHRKASKKEKQV